jgi:hypothetical protein
MELLSPIDRETNPALMIAGVPYSDSCSGAVRSSGRLQARWLNASRTPCHASTGRRPGAPGPASASKAPDIPVLTRKRLERSPSAGAADRGGPRRHHRGWRLSVTARRQPSAMVLMLAFACEEDSREPSARRVSARSGPQMALSSIHVRWARSPVGGNHRDLGAGGSGGREDGGVRARRPLLGASHTQHQRSWTGAPPVGRLSDRLARWGWLVVGGRRDRRQPHRLCRE